MNIGRARQLAAMCWCGEKTSNKVMDVELAEAFAATLTKSVQEARSEGISIALQLLKSAMQADESFAWSWHCNVAVCIGDEGVPHDIANRAAARFMKLAFDVDTSEDPHGK